MTKNHDYLLYYVCLLRYINALSCRCRLIINKCNNLIGSGQTVPVSFTFKSLSEHLSTW